MRWRHEACRLQEMRRVRREGIVERDPPVRVTFGQGGERLVVAVIEDVGDQIPVEVAVGLRGRRPELAPAVSQVAGALGDRRDVGVRGVVKATTPHLSLRYERLSQDGALAVDAAGKEGILIDEGADGGGE